MIRKDFAGKEVQKKIRYCKGSVGHEEDEQKEVLKVSGRRDVGDEPHVAEYFKSPGVYAIWRNASWLQDIWANFSVLVKRNY